MKNYLPTLIVMFSTFASAYSQIVADSITSYASVPPALSNITTINQPAQTASIQARWRTEADGVRTLVQTFQWNSDQSLGGLGLYLASNQLAFASSQAYELRIYSTSGYANGSTINYPALQTYSILLNSSVTIASTWMYIDFDSHPLALTNGSTYLFQIAPTAMVAAAANILFVGTAADTSYAYGTARQSGDAPASITGGAADLTFFLATVPEPSVASLFALSIGVFALLNRRRSVAARS